ncbi:hypothetical protein FRC02_008004 [Tulasnella sp. 418]|nr:hypothetical protein FRC02_008004 [Tulasnella sp. 418]
MPGKHPSPAKRKAALKSKKPPTAGTAPSNGTGNKHTKANHYNHTITAAAKPTNGLIPPLTSTPELERCISKILLLRYRMDICRLFSAHLHNVWDRILPVVTPQDKGYLFNKAL